MVEVHVALGGGAERALSPGFCATDLNRHTSTSTAAEGGAAIVREVLGSGERIGIFLSEDGGSYPW
ncbi:MAG TPA: hypothetical protein VGN81_39015 [Pseudonocardiaceae bacterium]